MYIEKLNSQDFITFTESLGYMVNNAITDIRVLKGKKTYYSISKLCRRRHGKVKENF